jgi:hypothetical protein
MVATGASGTPLDCPHADSPHHAPDSKDNLVIHLVSSLTLDGRFSAQDLPDTLQLPLLNSMVVPRIVSWSMTPTIQPGDSLELSPPISLTIGAIVVFRYDTMLICHRIIAIGPQGTLSTKGDATQGACEIVQPSSVIGVVTGVLRKGIHLSLGQGPPMPSAEAQPTGYTSCVRTVIPQFIILSLPILARGLFFRRMLATLLQWTATVDVLAPAPLRSLSSHSKIASFKLRKSPHRAGLLAVSSEQQSARYVVRLGPWQLAQYDQATESLLLRHSLRQAGLESIFRQIFSACQTTY